MKNWARIGLHLPIFAAAMTLAVANHGKAMMQLCLDNGADINYERTCPSYLRGKFQGRKPSKKRYWPSAYSKIYIRTTPLLIFLDSIKSFKSPNLPNPVEGLNWFFEHATEWKAPTVGRFIDGGTHSSAAEEVLLKWGLARFRETGFTEIIRILLRHQIVDRCPLSAYLRRWLFYNQGWPLKIFKEQDVKHGLATLTTVLLENLQFNIRFLLPFEDSDSVLANFISNRPLVQAAQMQDFDYIIIETLLEAGANINATSAIYSWGPRSMCTSGTHNPDMHHGDRHELSTSGMHGIYNGDRYELSALHIWCRELNYLVRHGRASLDAHGKFWFKWPWVYTDWIPQLIRYGADPTMPAGDKHETAWDLLVAECPCSSFLRLSTLKQEAIKEHIQDLASLWRKMHEDRLACGKKHAMDLAQGKALA
jgi:hypothetical protein